MGALPWALAKQKATELIVALARFIHVVSK